MQDNDTGTWLARDGDGRVVEVDAAGYPGAEADPGDVRPAAEAADPSQQARQTFQLPLGPPLADQSIWPERQAAEAQEPQGAREAELSPDAQDILWQTQNRTAERDALADAQEQRFADYWSAEGPDWEAAEADAEQAGREAEAG
jgi:hypothetical protein